MKKKGLAACLRCVAAVTGRHQHTVIEHSGSNSTHAGDALLSGCCGSFTSSLVSSLSARVCLRPVKNDTQTTM